MRTALVISMLLVSVHSSAAQSIRIEDFADRLDEHFVEHGGNPLVHVVRAAVVDVVRDGQAQSPAPAGTTIRFVRLARWTELQEIEHRLPNSAESIEMPVDWLKVRRLQVARFESGRLLTWTATGSDPGDHLVVQYAEPQGWDEAVASQLPLGEIARMRGLWLGNRTVAAAIASAEDDSVNLRAISDGEWGLSFRSSGIVYELTVVSEGDSTALKSLTMTADADATFGGRPLWEVRRPPEMPADAYPRDAMDGQVRLVTRFDWKVGSNLRMHGTVDQMRVTTTLIDREEQVSRSVVEYESVRVDSPDEQAESLRMFRPPDGANAMVYRDNMDGLPREWRQGEVRVVVDNDAATAIREAVQSATTRPTSSQPPSPVSDWQFWVVGFSMLGATIVAIVVVLRSRG